MRLKILLLLFVFWISPAWAAEYDVVIAGGGVGGIAAAIQAARGGARVAVFEPSSWIGGQMTAAGVSTMDDLSRQKSGIYLEFVNKVNDYYAKKGKSTGTCYWDNRSVGLEPHVGQKILYEMIDETKKMKSGGKQRTLDVFLLSSVVGVKRDGKNVTGVTAEVRRGSGAARKMEIACKVLIDATEYGDAIALAKIQYRAGNSSTPMIKLDGSMIQDITWTAVIKRYPNGVPRHLKAPFPLEGYDAARQNYEASVTRDGFDFKGVFPIETPVNFVSHNAYRAIPNSGTYVNYDGRREHWEFISKTGVNWGNDYPGKYGWATGKSGLPARYLDDPEYRKKANKEAFFKTLHFIYYMQTELDQSWSVADDEYVNENLPPEILSALPVAWHDIAKRMPVIPYVRESRRIIGERTLTSSEILKNSLSYRDGQTSAEFPNAIAIGGYPLDLHNAASNGDLEWELGESEKSIYANRPRGAFQVPLDILIPKDIDGFIAAEKNLSMSRLSAGAIRLQPISMMTGQAAGALAGKAVALGTQPRDVHPLAVQSELVKYGVSLSLCKYSDIPPEHPLFGAIQISNLYGLMEPLEYPHVPSYNITDFDDPKLAMAMLRGADKGVFGLDRAITAADLATAIRRAIAVLEPAAAAEFERTINENKKKLNPARLVSRGEVIKILTDAMVAAVVIPASSANTPPVRK